MGKWDIYVHSPRWLELSGLPQKICRENGPAAWIVFKKLTEIECEANLLPDWFSASASDLSTRTGIGEKELDQALTYLQREDLVEIQKMEGGWRVRIQTPLPVPDPEAKIRERLQIGGVDPASIRLRYLEDDTSQDRFNKVLELYQSVFGTRMTSQIADELREIAENFEWPAIEEAFEEAREHKKTNFYSVLNQLYKELHDEQVAENLRDASRPSLPPGYELT